MKTKDLIFDDKNANKHTERGLELLEQSVKEFGMGRSILIDKNNRIIGGNGIIETCNKLGVDDVQVVESDGTKIIAVKRTDIDLDTAKGRKMALADNATNAANLEWDKDVLETYETDYDIDLQEWDVPTWGDDEEQEKENYSRKIETPDYVPTGREVSVDDCYDKSKANELVEEIKKANIKKDVKDLLLCAAMRFIEYDFANIAELYSQEENEDVKALMRKLAMVIVDFDEAIENGFVRLSQNLIDEYKNEQNE